MLESPPKKLHIAGCNWPPWLVPVFSAKHAFIGSRADRPARLGSDLLISEEHVFKLPREPGTCQIIWPVRKAEVLQQKPGSWKEQFFFISLMFHHFLHLPHHIHWNPQETIYHSWHHSYWVHGFGIKWSHSMGMCRRFPLRRYV